MATEGRSGRQDTAMRSTAHDRRSEEGNGEPRFPEGSSR